jgi:hypothetical protein
MNESVQKKSGSATGVRAVLAVIIGAIVWMAGFLVLARVLAALWPAYASAARIWTQTANSTFTTAMSIFNASFWIIAEIAAGWLAAVIARRAGAVWTLAAIVMAYLCFAHFYWAWHKLPWWYNLIVALSSGPAVLLGGRLSAAPGRTLAPTGRSAS